MKERQCCECRDGEHENLAEKVALFLVRDPDTKKIVRRGYLCEEHVTTNLEDGYEVLSQGVN